MDVLVSYVVRNSVSRVGESVIERSVGSVVRELGGSVRLVYVVDDGDDGSGKTICGMFGRFLGGVECIVERSRLYGHHRPTRATARQTAIDWFLGNTSLGWLMFVDDDVELRQGWMAETERLLRDAEASGVRVGGVWGVNWDATPDRERFLKMMGVDYEDHLVKAFRLRGGTHDTLVKREALEGIIIPPELHVYEDAFLKWYVECRGYTWLINRVGCTHYKAWNLVDALREEREKLRLAIEVAARYGIVEYDSVRDALSGGSKLKAVLSLARPVLGFAPMYLVSARVFGPWTGLKITVQRQLLKLLSRWYAVKAAFNGLRLPNTCEAVLGYVEQARRR